MSEFVKAFKLRNPDQAERQCFKALKGIKSLLEYSNYS
ncbi:hypothetical protein DOT_0856 [Desulfosporosinus sp. OT]|nr:hypothetical protein DOT_0856 [Desulfosporosinus sp. OT]